MFTSILHLHCFIDSFDPIAPFLYSLKTAENLTIKHIFLYWVREFNSVEK